MARHRGVPLRAGDVLHHRAGIEVRYNGPKSVMGPMEGHELRVTHDEAHGGSTETNVQVMLSREGRMLAIVKHPDRAWPIPRRDQVFREAIDAGVDAFVRRHVGEDHEFDARRSDDGVEQTQRVQHREYIRGGR